MGDIDFSLLESKLKRHNIKYSKIDGQIVIGSAKKEYLYYWFLGVLPLLFGIGLILFVVLELEYLDPAIVHLITIAVFLIGTGVFNIWRIKRKHSANKKYKTFNGKSIIVEDKAGAFELNSETIRSIRRYSQQLDKEVFEGNIVIIDTKDRVHHILRIHDENEKYIADDLKWFVDFMINQIGINQD